MTAPVDALRLAGCAGKAPLTRQQAKVIADRMSRARKGKAAAGCYQCEYCCGWHIGTRK